MPKSLVTVLAHLLAFCLSLLALGACQPMPEPADLVLTGGKIVTLAEGRGVVSALAARGDRIVALGSEDEVRRLVGPQTRVVDLEGRLAIPGFIEGHGHFLGVGQAGMQLRLSGVESWEQIVEMVAEAVAKAQPGEWIEGRGWHQEKWIHPPAGAVDGLPTHHALSAVSPDNPVVLRHASGHASLANAKAMELGGVTATTTAPEGGEIVRSEDGEPIGVFRETAASLVARKTPPSEAELRQMVALATQECLAKGITTFQDAGSPLEWIDLLTTMADEGALRLRLWVMIRDSNERLRDRLADVRRVGYADNFLTVRAIKHSIDGALGSHGAWLLEPYSDMPGSTGLNTTSVGTIEESARLALEHGYQLCVHSIGDRANRETLDIFEAAYAENPDRDLRWRVEHAQHLHPDEIPRFASLGAIASMQAVHCTSDGPWVPQRLGEKRSREGAYVWRKLMDSGAVVTNGTDAPVEDVDPLPNFYAAVTRRMSNGEVFYPDQVMTREEALRAYTWNVAYSGFEEDLKGSLEIGKLADITVLSKDILTIPEEEILETRVVHTIVGGKVEYSRE